MAYTDILYEIKDRVATITLNRPDKLNAWTRVMEAEVREAMERAGADDGVRVIILTVAGRGFCAGADMSLLSAIEDSSDEGETAQRRALQRDPMTRQLDLPADFSMRYTYFTSVPKPVIAAINGPCAGLGLVLALYCDLRFAADEAMFTTAFARRGLIAEHGIDWILPRIVGLANAFDLLLSAGKIPAREALEIGLVNKLFPAATFIDEVRDYAGELASAVSARSMRIMKAQLYRTQGLTLAEAVNRGFDEMIASFASPDFREGVAHFVEKRAPAFADR